MTVPATPQDTAQFSYENGSHERTTLSLPVLKGSLGPAVVDIAPLAKANLFTFDPGFVCTAACESSITFIDGNEGILLHRGYPIEELAQQGHFLVVAYLLFYGELPTAAQLEAFTQQITQEMAVPAQLQKLLNGFPTTAHPMSILCSLTSALAGYYHSQYDIHSAADRERVAHSLIAKMPTLAAMAYRYTQQQRLIEPNPELSYTANFLQMMFADEQGNYTINPTLVNALESIFILHADHEQNASTSSVRLCGSTGSDPFTCIAAGIAALWGPAHGGANEAALNMLKEIGSIDHIDHYLARAKDHDDPFRLMGFGHRVYKNYDPRAKVMRQECYNVLQVMGAMNAPLFQLALKLEQIALEDPYFISRKLYPNVDFYSGITLSAMGIPTTMFTAIFALARTSGWISHWNELMMDPNMKIGRPRQLYLGPSSRPYKKLQDRL
jgi:citrate synthase